MNILNLLKRRTESRIVYSKKTLTYSVINADNQVEYEGSLGGCELYLKTMNEQRAVA